MQKVGLKIEFRQLARESVMIGLGFHVDAVEWDEGAFGHNGRSFSFLQ